MPTPIRTQEELDNRVEEIRQAIQSAVDASVPPLVLCAHSKRWWTKELRSLEEELGNLGCKTFRARWDPHDLVHEEYRWKRNVYSQAIRDAKEKHWETFLEELDEETMWTAAKYLNNDGEDGGRARIPSLSYTDDHGQHTAASDNATKSRVLLESFFHYKNPIF